MIKLEYKMRAKVWLYPGAGGWHFVTLPAKDSAAIKKAFGTTQRGWDSLPVLATVGKSSWKTSIFPDKKIEAYVLPLKADVRKKENIKLDRVIAFSVQIEP